MAVYGIDVSSYQSGAPGVSGKAFMFVKATEGTSYVNPKHAEQTAHARASGLVLGFYHFLHAGNIAAQAAYFVQQSKAKPGDILAVDWEASNGRYASSAEKDLMLAEVKRLRPDCRVILYCNTDFWKRVDLSGKCGDGLWIASYVQAGKPDFMGAKLTSWLFHQYTDQPIDSNVANFPSVDALNEWAHGDAEQPEEEARGMPVNPAHLKMNARCACVKPFQTALKAKKCDPGPVDGWYGAKTKAACTKFQKLQGWSGKDADGFPGAQSIRLLGLWPDSKLAHSDGEPAHNYSRVTYGGAVVNVRTRTMLENAKKLLTAYEWNPRLTQGSYNRGGVRASAGTHDGGGVVDINTSSMTVNGMKLCVQALRKAGFAAWLRTPAQGFAYHIHAVAIGDRELSSSAKDQIVQWRQDRNGLANWGRDYEADPYPSWTRKYR